MKAQIGKDLTLRIATQKWVDILLLWLLLQVKACKGAYVAISSIPGITTSQTYEIAIGGDDNDRVEIRPGVGVGAVESNTGLEDLLSCDEPRY